ncbi:hypothetical protein ACFE04_004745 [Oxalis oulophora]
MVLAWRRHGASRFIGETKSTISGDNSDLEITIPSYFRCPVSLDLMKDPVTLSTGITYDRESIEKWVESGNKTCPVTNQALITSDQIPNHVIRKMIQTWCVENKSFGVERIPTPRIPVTAYEVKETCSRLKATSQRGDGKKCRELVMKVKNWVKESERNKRCIKESSIRCLLADCFESFANSSIEENADLLLDILSTLVYIFPSREEGQSKLGSSVSLRCIVWFLKSGNLSARQIAVLVLKNIVSSNEKHVKAVLEIEGIVEVMLDIIKEPICCPRATKASLMVIYYMVSSSEEIQSRFVELGLVSTLIEIVVDGGKDISEKALGVLDSVCGSEQGRELAYNNALVVPLLVKKISTVPDLTTEFSISGLWKLCKNEKREDILVEVLQLGAFDKLLVLLQVFRGENKTKENITCLLKLLNLQRSKLDCVDTSVNFKYLKRSF